MRKQENFAKRFPKSSVSKTIDRTRLIHKGNTSLSLVFLSSRFSKVFVFIVLFFTLHTKVSYIPKCMGSKEPHFLHVYATIEVIFRLYIINDVNTKQN